MRFYQIPENTFSALELEAGILLTSFNPASPAVQDANILCATTGGISVSCVPSFSDFGEDVDNCPNNMMEMKHLDSWDCTMSFTSISLTPAGIKFGLGAADIDGTDASKVTPRMALKNDHSDFTDLWWVGDRADGGLVACHISNALSTGGISITTSKGAKGTMALTVTGHVSIDAQDVVPMEFYSSNG